MSKTVEGQVIALVAQAQPHLRYRVVLGKPVGRQNGAHLILVALRADPAGTAWCGG